MPDITDRPPLLQAIAAQEGLRGTLPDVVIEATLAALHKQLDELDAAAAATDQQRKHVTVLFADMAGFTATSELMDAELVAERINRVWQELDAIIIGHGGRIDKHIGDAVMALWGTETAREDDPEQAIRAALTIQAVMDARTNADAPITLRIGIHSGPVLLGHMGSNNEFTAMGDTVNLASRLEELANPGTVLISHATYSLVRGVFDVDERPPVSVKGKAEPVLAYEVLRARPRAFNMSTRGVEGVTTHMIGRDLEFGLLQSAYLDMLKTAEPQALVIVGDAGVGKSRLLHEFEQWIELRPETLLYFKGRATPALQTTPYSLFRDLFAFRFDIRESDSRTVALEKFHRGMVAGLAPLTVDQVDVMGQWLGFDFSQSRAVANLLGNSGFGPIARSYFVRYFATLATAGPMTLLLEDIHWADDQSLDLIIYLIQAIPRGQFLMVGNTRPALYERRPRWGEGEATLQRVALGPLSKRGRRELVEEILQRVDEVPAELRDTIVDAAEGNPFYTEELVKMFIEQGVIHPGDADEHWRVQSELLAEVSVPGTLTGLLQARLDALPRPEQEVLQRAAVVGRLFWDGAVADLLEMTPAEVQPLLLASRNREIIFQREHSAFDGNLELIFKHSLLRDVAYERVLLRHRQTLHGRVARWLEAHATDRLSEYLSQIAEHYRLAGEDDQAASYLLRAGRDAFASTNFTAARHALEEAIALKAEAPENDRVLVMSLVLLAEIEFYQGDLAEAERVARRGLAGARVLEDITLQSEVLATLVTAAQRQGRQEQARQLAEEEALPLARKVGGATLARTLLSLAFVLRSLGDIEQAAQYATEALDIARRIGNTNLQARAMTFRLSILEIGGNIDRAMKGRVEVLEFARATGNLYVEAIVLIGLGDTAYKLGDYEAARSYGLDALAMMGSLGARQQTIPLTNIAQAEMMLGEYETARRYVTEALQRIAGQDLQRDALFAIQVWAEILVVDGDREQALAILCAVHDHPANDYEGRHEMDGILTRLEATDDELEGAKTAAAGLDLDAVARDILAYTSA